MLDGGGGGVDSNMVQIGSRDASFEKGKRCRVCWMSHGQHQRREERSHHISVLGTCERVPRAENKNGNVVTT